MPAPSSNSATSSTGSDGARGKGNSATSSTELTNAEDYEMEKKEIIDVILCIDQNILQTKKKRLSARSLHVTASLSKFKLKFKPEKKRPTLSSKDPMI